MISALAILCAIGVASAAPAFIDTQLNGPFGAPTYVDTEVPELTAAQTIAVVPSLGGRPNEIFSAKGNGNIVEVQVNQR